MTVQFTRIVIALTCKLTEFYWVNGILWDSLWRDSARTALWSDCDVDWSTGLPHLHKFAWDVSIAYANEPTLSRKQIAGKMRFLFWNSQFESFQWIEKRAKHKRGQWEGPGGWWEVEVGAGWDGIIWLFPRNPLYALPLQLFNSCGWCKGGDGWFKRPSRGGGWHKRGDGRLHRAVGDSREAI